MPKKNSGLSLFLSLAFLVSGCATVPDVPVCVEMTMSRGRCVKIVSGEQLIVDDHNLLEGKTWWEIRPAMVLLPASSWAQIKAFIVKTCRQNGQCQDQIDDWERTAEVIDSGLEQRTK